MPEPTLTPATPPTATPAGMPNAEEDVTTTLYRAAIGPVNPDFYLPIFARFEAADRAGLSWNTAAGLLTFNWLVYRQLWGAAMGYAGIVLAVVLLVFGIGRVVLQLSDNLTMALSLGLGLAAVVLPGLLGNALFQKECRKRMAKALADHSVLADARLDLQRQSSSRLRMLWVAMANVAVLGIVAFAYLQLSALNTLTVLPQGALEAGHVAPGLAASNSPLATTPAPVATASAAPVAAASAPDIAASAPAAVASAASGPALAASAPAAAPSAAQLAAPAASSAPAAAVASAPALATVAPEGPRPAPVPLAASKTAPAKPEVPPANTQAQPRSKPNVAAKPDTQAPGKAASAAVPAAPTKPAPPEALFYINVGLFSKPQNAARVHAQLLEARMPSVMKELKSDKVRQIRVRVGPFATEAQAEAAAEKIKTLKFDAGIIQQ